MVDVPVALLQLYESSDYIYIGTFNRLEDHDVVEGDAEGVTFEVKRHFDISSSLKGETRKSLVLDHTEYRSTPADKEPEGKDSSADEASSDDEETESAPEAAPEDS
ncbi:MAG TPA: hypothetical protein VNA22_04050, partial [Pyrinomonadaceae bacterium]|nr:hypothetical protein [Pyrinomonadaceae bacterium]